MFMLKKILVQHDLDFPPDPLGEEQGQEGDPDQEGKGDCHGTREVGAEIPHPLSQETEHDQVESHGKKDDRFVSGPAGNLNPDITAPTNL